VLLLGDARELPALLEARPGSPASVYSAGPRDSYGLDVYLTPAQAVVFSLKGIEFPPWASEARFLFAGDRLPAKVAQRLARLYPGSRVANMYGQVELGPRVSIRETAMDEFEEGVVGKPLAGVDVRVGEGGRIQVRSAYQMLGYVGGPDGEARGAGALDASAPPDWVDTGDLGSISPSGEIAILGRAGRHVNLGGQRINLSDFEQCVLAVPGVLNCRARSSGSIVGKVRLVIQTTEGDGAEEAARARLLEVFKNLYSLIELEVYNAESNSKGAGKL